MDLKLSKISWNVNQSYYKILVPWGTGIVLKFYSEYLLFVFVCHLITHLFHSAVFKYP